MYSWGHFNLQFNDKAIEPLGESVSSTELFRPLAVCMGYQEDTFGSSDQRIMETALDWENGALEGITFDRLKKDGFARLNVGPSQTRIPHKYGNFGTSSGKFEFASSFHEEGSRILEVYRQGTQSPMIMKAVDPLPNFRLYKTCGEDELTLISSKQHGFLNSGYANSSQNKNTARKQIALIHPAGASLKNLVNGDRVKLWNELGEIKQLLLSQMIPFKESLLFLTVCGVNTSEEQPSTNLFPIGQVKLVKASR